MSLNQSNAVAQRTEANDEGSCALDTDGMGSTVLNWSMPMIGRARCHQGFSLFFELRCVLLSRSF